MGSKEVSLNFIKWQYIRLDKDYRALYRRYDKFCKKRRVLISKKYKTFQYETDDGLKFNESFIPNELADEHHDLFEVLRQRWDLRSFVDYDIPNPDGVAFMKFTPIKLVRKMDDLKSPARQFIADLSFTQSELNNAFNEFCKAERDHQREYIQHHKKMMKLKREDWDISGDTFKKWPGRKRCEELAKMQ